MFLIRFNTFLYFRIVFLKVSAESIAPVSQSIKKYRIIVTVCKSMEINASQCLLQVVKGLK